MTDSIGNLFDLSGRTAVVTGGNRGIGLGMAMGLAQAGANLSIWARDKATLDTAGKALSADGVEVQLVECDVSSEANILEATAQTLKQFGRIDIGIANSGFGRAADPMKLELEEFREILATNLEGVFLCFREWSRHMSSREGGGKLIAISSISAIFSTPMQPHYAASKGGLESLVRSYAGSLARHGIQVNAVQPGWIETRATQMAADNEDFSRVIMQRVPARRWGTPRDLAGIAVYLASPASDYHTGDTLRVDGGYSMF